MTVVPWTSGHVTDDRKSLKRLWRSPPRGGARLFSSLPTLPRHDPHCFRSLRSDPAPGCRAAPAHAGASERACCSTRAVSIGRAHLGLLPGRRAALRRSERTVKCSDLDDAHLRLVPPSQLRRRPHPSIVDEEVRAVVEQDCGEFLESVWDSMTCPMLPGTPSAMKVAQRKAAHLWRARGARLRIAPTLFTNDPQEFLDLYREQERPSHSQNQLPASRSRRAWGTDFMRLTRGRQPSGRGARRVGRGLAPIVFQSYVPKTPRTRATVVGDRVFAAEIHSQDANRSRFDWRRYDLGRTPHLPHQLPGDLAERCVKLVAQSGLTLRRDRSDSHARRSATYSLNSTRRANTGGSSRPLDYRSARPSRDFLIGDTRPHMLDSHHAVLTDVLSSLDRIAGEKAAPSKAQRRSRGTARAPLVRFHRARMG